MRPFFLLFQLILPLAIFCGDAEAQGWISCLIHQTSDTSCELQFKEARLIMEGNPKWIEKLENERRNAAEHLIKCIGSDPELKPFLDYAIQTAHCAANGLKGCQNETFKMKILAIVFIGGFLVQSIAFLVVTFLLCRRRKLTGSCEVPK